MSELVDLLTEAFDAAPAAPAEGQLSNSISATAYWSFQPSLEVVVAESARPPADGQAVAAWRNRLARRPVPLVLLVESSDGVVVVGPSGTPPPVFRVDPRLIVRDLAEASKLDPLDARRRLTSVWERVRGAAGLTGLRNVGLFSTHYLSARVPQLAEWRELERVGKEAAAKRTVLDRLSALGFEYEQRGEGIYVLRTENRPAAAVLSYPASRDLDRASAGGELPVATLLREMEAAGVDWGVLVSGELWRIYSAQHPARMTSFVELDLSRLNEPGYFAVLFSATALRRGGLAERIGEGSRDFAVGLGDRLRDRIYERVVPSIARSVADELDRLGERPEAREQLDAVYQATLVLLYRLLFVLYAESREYLPVNASAGYRDHSLRQRIDSVVATVESGREFATEATDIWSDLTETFTAIAGGQTEWGVPPYNGGLFVDDLRTPAGNVLARVRPRNEGLGPALYHLAVDAESAESGRIDYSDLDIRHLGDVYEGLLQFEVDRARENLAYDPSADAYVPAAGDQPVAVSTGDIYLRGRSGGRKASGSYYTPQIVVRHVVEEALIPAHAEHLARVSELIQRGDDEAAARLLWDFRVCDPAMGSGHFLVDALDVLTDRIAAFLAETPLAPVRSVLNQLRETVQEQARDLPAGVLEQIRDVELLKRVVLKRSIYGVDLNEMAVELSKLALWLHAFVPGLPLSYLDHNLRQGNSLVGVVGTEVLDALQPDQATLEESWAAEQLRKAGERARAAVERVEFRLEDVEAAQEAELERRAATTVLQTVYNRWTAESFGLVEARTRITQLDTLEAEDDAREAAVLAEQQNFFHWPLELPEVFDRERPGFDVVLANPPWEKLKVERHDWFQMRLPGLKFVTSAEERDRRIAELVAADPAVQEDYEQTIRRVDRLKGYFRASAGNYRLHGGGDPDLFKAFAERFMHLARVGGTLGCVLPRQLLGGGGSQALRTEFFTRWTVLSADVLWNRRVWAFPSVFHRTRMTLLAARRSDPPPDARIPSAGPLGDADTFLKAQQLRVSFPVATLRSWSDALELPSLPDAEAGELFAAMMTHPRFDDPSRPWRVVPYRELDATGDRSLFNEREVGWPVWKGRSFDRYQPDLSPPIYWADPEPVLTRLQEKRRQARSVFGDLPDDVLADPTTLPPLDCRIVFRDVVRATDRRTTKACLAPPRIFAIHDAPQLVWLRGVKADWMYVLSVLNSLPFDWLVRRRVETHVTFGILNALPVPESDARNELSSRAARLSCVDDRYTDFAEELNVECGPVEEHVRNDTEALIDALVACAYGLDEAGLRLIFEDFVDAAVSQSYRELVLSHFKARM